MKKVAILTLYYKNFNYGGILQAYALQKAIEQIGFSSEQISYRLNSGYKDLRHLKLSIKLKLLYLYNHYKYHKWMIEYDNQRKKLEKFAYSIPHSKIVNVYNISRISKQYDWFICGSDQIWNPIGWQPTLFLNFVPSNKKKISYAASIARDNLTTDHLKYIRKFTADFAAISVREKNSADILNKSYPELKVEYMPDPVFLLEETEWKKPVQSKRNAEPFIFAYFLGDDFANREKALTYARNNGLKIIFASHLNFSHYQWEKEHKDVCSPPLGIEDFLSHIANASLVLTDSFHAAAFSSIYKTPFYALPRFKTNDKNSMNSRIIDLVEELDISNRFTDKICGEFEWKKYEMDNIEYNLERLRKRGVEYLERTLCNVKGAS